jgi:Alkylmercury lyase
MSLTDRDLELRHRIFMEFAANGAPGEHGDLSTLAEHHVVVLDDDGQIAMAHPFAAHHGGARVQSDGREWWGNCAWDAFGIVAALNLEPATITAQGITLQVRNDDIDGDAVFHVLVPAAHWWDDIGHT